MSAAAIGGSPLVNANEADQKLKHDTPCNIPQNKLAEVAIATLRKLSEDSQHQKVLASGLSFVKSEKLAEEATGPGWEQIFKDAAILLGEPDYQIIKKQQVAFSSNLAPAIADLVIKSIVIVENNEKLIDVNEKKHPRIVMLPSHPRNQIFAEPIYNSGLPNASKIRENIWDKLEQLLGGLDELAEVFGYRRGKISIKIFEGLRDIETQKALFQNKVNEIKLRDPLLSDEAAEAEAAKWVSPIKNNIPAHSTGAAIDIRLYNDEIEAFIDLGPFGVIWGANKEAQTFSENISGQQKLNRLYLLMAAAKAGLINYVYEYWHFSAGDRYAAYWQEKNLTKRVACYGAVGDSFFSQNLPS